MPGSPGNPIDYVPKHYVKNGEIASDDSEADSKSDTSSEEKKNSSPIGTSFDFLTSKGIEAMPIGVVVAQIGARRRPKSIPRDATREEFASIIGISVDDTKDPDTRTSFLQANEGVRSYYGDSEDEAYKWFRENMLLFSEDAEFVKGNYFLDGDLQRDYHNLKQFEDMALARGVEDDKDANELEVDFYTSLRSKAHSMYLDKYRAGRKNTQVPRRLCFEYERRKEEERRASRRKVQSAGGGGSVGGKYRLQLVHMFRGGIHPEPIKKAKSRKEYDTMEW